jgi:excisionase family DNA binding protein
MGNRIFGYFDTGDDLITQDSPEAAAFFASLEELLEGVEKIAENSKPLFYGERYLTDIEVSERLKVSRRTLQEWRYSGKIAYLQVGGKMIFRESDIQAILDKGLRPAFR